MSLPNLVVQWQTHFLIHPSFFVSLLAASWHSESKFYREPIYMRMVTLVLVSIASLISNI